MLIAPEPLDSTVYQHKTPYRGETRIIEELLAILVTYTTGVITHVRHKFAQIVSGIRSSLT